MKEIVFKCGIVREIPANIADIIGAKITSKEGGKDFQVFSEGENKVIYIIKVSEIAFIGPVKQKRSVL